MYSRERAEGIIQYVSNKTQISVEAMKSPSRHRNVVTARQCAIWIIKKDMNEITLRQLASHFGNRHHATIIYSIDAVEDQLCCNNKNFTWVKKILLDEEKHTSLETIAGQLHKALKAINLGHISEARLRIETAIEKLNHDRAEGTG
jgi:hypothetical protein